MERKNVHPISAFFQHLLEYAWIYVEGANSAYQQPPGFLAPTCTAYRFRNSSNLVDCIQILSLFTYVIIRFNSKK